LSEWWTAVSGLDHEQGDLLAGFPVHRVLGSLTDPSTTQIRIDHIDGIIVTQSCDLANTKTRTILIGRVITWKAYAQAQYRAGNTAVKSEVYLKNLIAGGIPPLALLHERTTRPTLDWSVADFRELYSIDRNDLDAFIARPGTKQRLRLNSPYKEHFAQAFARYFMRVGLPHDAHGFPKAGKAATAHLI
jgi:hypothetical protein